MESPTEQSTIDGFITYVGPAYAGQDESVKRLYEATAVEDRRSTLWVVPPKAPSDARIMWFEFAPPWLPAAKPERLFRVATVPGMDFEGHAREEVAALATAFVFVVDSRWERYDAAFEMLESLREFLASRGKALEQYPLALQVNLMDEHREGLDEFVRRFSSQLPEGTPVFFVDPKDDASLREPLRAVITAPTAPQ